MTGQERGAATAEYTVGTVGATCIAYWLLRLTVGDPNSWYDKLVHKLFSRAFDTDNWAWMWLM